MVPMTTLTCCCGKIFEMKAAAYKHRIRKSRTKTIYCSRKCAIHFTRKQRQMWSLKRAPCRPGDRRQGDK